MTNDKVPPASSKLALRRQSLIEARLVLKDPYLSQRQCAALPFSTVFRPIQCASIIHSPIMRWLCQKRFLSQRKGHNRSWCVGRTSSSPHRPRLLSQYSSTTSNTSHSTTIVVALSGGVDSAVAAAILAQGQQNVGGGDGAGLSSYNLVGVHMSNWNRKDDDSLANTVTCSSDQDWYDAKQTAQHIQLPLVRLRKFESDYWCHVFEPFVQTLFETGTMGNPDIDCNTHVKFGALLQYCFETYGQQSNHTYLATGHYARLWHRNGGGSYSTPYDHAYVATTSDRGSKNIRSVPPCVEAAITSANESSTGNEIDWLRHWGDGKSTLLLSALDRTKDQSYFLSGCRYTALRHLIFPLGECYKSTAPTNVTNPSDHHHRPLSVREMAEQFSLPVARKRESMGICFVGKRRNGFGSFVADYVPPPQYKLRFVDVDTNHIVYETNRPAHAFLYTSGQGAKISGTSEKYFCVDNHWNGQSAPRQYSHNNKPPPKDEYHIVSVCRGTHHPALYSDTLFVHVMNWLCATPPTPLLQTGHMRAQCRIRHLQPLVHCTVTMTNCQNKDNVASSSGATTITVHFDTPVRGITRGQMVVLYVLDGLVCLGGGPIASRGLSYFELGKSLPTDLHPSGHNDLSIQPAQEAATA